MGILGTAVFLLIFVMLVPASREHVGLAFGAAVEWIGKWAPFSYIAVFLALIIPVAGVITIMKWPEPPEPENPLARFKTEEPLD